MLLPLFPSLQPPVPYPIESHPKAISPLDIKTLVDRIKIESSIVKDVKAQS
jgi:hypothetical protein